MAKFAIPKKITFEYLGEEFKDSYLIFRSIPVEDFEKLDALLDKSKTSPEVPLPILIKTLQTYFLSGKFYDYASKELQEIKSSELGLLDSEVIVNCFTTITGSIDPKKKLNSMDQSSTETIQA